MRAGDASMTEELWMSAPSYLQQKSVLCSVQPCQGGRHSTRPNMHILVASGLQDHQISVLLGQVTGWPHRNETVAYIHDMG